MHSNASLAACPSSAAGGVRDFCRMQLRQAIERAANGMLSPLGVRIIRHGRAPTIGGRRMSDERVIAEARRHGVSPGALLEQIFNKPGRARSIVDRLAATGALPGRDGVVLEIGAGSGLYVEQVLARGRVQRYEVYELEKNRAEYLAHAYRTVARHADGETLAATPSRSIDLVHAHGVFVTLPFLTAVSYFREIARVIAAGGFAVFDIISESSLDDAAIEAWLASGLRYPHMLSRRYVVELFERNGFRLVDEFSMPLLVHGRSSYLTFRYDGKESAGV
jgi:SAM-dependent methyltransferase